jgi:hypothetical protein
LNTASSWKDLINANVKKITYCFLVTLSIFFCQSLNFYVPKIYGKTPIFEM